MRGQLFRIREFPRDERFHESAMLGTVRLVFKADMPPAEPLPVMARTVSDRSTAAVRLTIGSSTLVMSGYQAEGLARALLEHCDHLGDLCAAMVDDRVEDAK